MDSKSPFKDLLFPRGPNLAQKPWYLVGTVLKCFVIYLDFLLNNHMAKTNKHSAVRATTVQLYPGRDTFEFDQGHVTKNQPITELILSSESPAI